MSKRVNEGDVDLLRDLFEMRELLDDLINDGIEKLHDEPHGYSYGEIARSVGVSQQSISKRAARKT